MLRDEILSRPDCADALALRDCGALAEILSKDRTKKVDLNIGYGTVLEALGADDGAKFLDQLTALADTSSPVKWALKLLDRGELNIGATITQQQLDALAEGGVMSKELADVLKGLAVVDDPYSIQDVILAMGW